MAGQLRHGGHEGARPEVALQRLCDWLLRGGVELLLEGDWLKRGEPAPYVIDYRESLRLSGRQTCRPKNTANIFTNETNKYNATNISSLDNIS